MEDSSGFTGSDSQDLVGRRTDEWSECLVLIATRQDRAAFTRFFRHFAPLIKAFALSGSRLSASVADELVQEVMLKELWDETSGGFFLVGAENRELPVRPKEIYDGAVPSANSVALLNLLWLSRLTGNPAWEEKADRLVRAFADSIGRQPSAFTFFLCGLDFALRPGVSRRRAGDHVQPWEMRPVFFQDSAQICGSQ